MTDTFNPIQLNFDGNPAPKIRKYNSWNVSFTWTDSNNEPINLSFYTGAMQIRKTVNSDSVLTLTSQSGNITLDVDGNISLSLSSEETSGLVSGTYLYDLVLTDTSSTDTNGSGYGVFTLIFGEIHIEDGITRSIE